MTFSDARGKRLVAVMPHPDDESYSCGGTLALAAESGADVWVVAATRGESGWVRDEDRHGHAPIGELRSTELSRSCEALGIHPPRYLGWIDAAVADIPERTREAELRDVLDELSPDVVITLAPDGVYGHKDHVAVTNTCKALAGPFRLLLADFPRGLFAGLARTFMSIPGDFLVADVDPDGLGCDPADVDLRVDIRAIANRKHAAIASHDSQLLRAEPLQFLFAGLVQKVSGDEWFRLGGGPALPDGATSPFAGLP